MGAYQEIDCGVLPSCIQNALFYRLSKSTTTYELVSFTHIDIYKDYCIIYLPVLINRII